MAHREKEGPVRDEEGGGLWTRPHPPEVRSALKVVADYYGIDPEELEGLLDNIVPLLDN